MSWLWPNATSVAEFDWERVYERELPRIYNYFRYRIGDDALSEDLTSAVFEKAWRARDTYRRDTAKFSTWLFAIARNVAIDHFRRAGRELPLDHAIDIPSETTPEDDAVRLADLKHLEGLLTGLGDRERELIAFKFGAELTNREIAKVTKLSESNVGTILHRAMATLRERW